jgi:2-methylisocitrate lyase-like PEP mutase family enzyme
MIGIVRRTVEELETAGICAMSIEDTVPRPFGPNPNFDQILN